MAGTTVRIPSSLPLIVIGNDVLLPGATIRVPIISSYNLAVVKHLFLSRNTAVNTFVGVVIWEAQNPDTKLNTAADINVSLLHPIGTVAAVVQIAGTNWPQPSYTLLLSGVCRFRLKELKQCNPYPVALVEQVDKLSALSDDQVQVQHPELMELMVSTRSKALALLDQLDTSLPAMIRLKRMLGSVSDHNLADLCASVVNASIAEKLEILDAIDLTERFRKTLLLLQRQLEALPVARRQRRSLPLDSPALRSFSYRRLPNVDPNGEGDMDADDLVELENKLKEANLPDHAQKVATKEMRRLKKLMPHLPDYNVTRTYLELMSELPWSKSSQQTLDIHKARLDLDADHYAMEKVKKRVLEYLAVRQLRNSLRGPILCFVGPPGVGKTSIGRSIANTIGREFHRISLGGVCDQSDIRGHRRTYIGAFPGRIVQGLRTVGVNNPVFLLDEIDKLSAGIHGDPSAALLEVLDPEQNCSYTDHYLNIPFDLSQVLFIATANSVRNIPPALLDRMEVIPVSGYTQEEKLYIATKHLIPKQILEHGLDEKVLQISEECVKLIISRYTREAGVRSLERKIGALCRAVAVIVAEGTSASEAASQHSSPDIPIVIDENAVEDILGLPPFDNEVSVHSDQPGVAVGLAWTPVGGDIMYVEATKMEGDGRLVLTGQLGSVMRESAKLALNWVRTHAEDYGISVGKDGSVLMEHLDIHIHFPAGAQGKDGPSAGVTIVCVLVSLFTGRCVSHSVAMTGEVTLRGLVLPVGGIKDKVLAAHRAGITKVILPARNQKDLNEIPTSIQKDMTFIFVKYIDDVLQAAFDGGFPESRVNVDNIIPSNL